MRCTRWLRLWRIPWVRRTRRMPHLCNDTLQQSSNFGSFQYARVCMNQTGIAVQSVQIVSLKALTVHKALASSQTHLHHHYHSAIILMITNQSHIYIITICFESVSRLIPWFLLYLSFRGYKREDQAFSTGSIWQHCWANVRGLSRSITKHLAAQRFLHFLDNSKFRRKFSNYNICKSRANSRKHSNYNSCNLNVSHNFQITTVANQ